MNDSLHNLGMQYAKEVKNLDEMIVASRKRKGLAWKCGDRVEVARQECIIESHLEQRRDLMQISGHLRGYYL